MAIAADVQLVSASSAAMGSCTTSPELDEGPFYWFEELVRTDLVENEPGVPMDLIITVHDPDCNPLHGVFVDVWSCNTTGIYSGFAGKAKPVLLCSPSRHERDARYAVVCLVS